VNRKSLLIILLLIAGCRPEGPSRQEATQSSQPDSIKEAPRSTPQQTAVMAPPPSEGIFTNITAAAGIKFSHFNDASGRKYLPETMGSGAAFFDYDGDGRPDLYLVNGCPILGDRHGAKSGVLYRNLDGLHFQDVTRQAGLAEVFYGMGAAVGDIDNDGHIDLFVAGLDGDRLFRNRGDGSFEDVTQKMGLADRGFGSSAAFLDYDRDGYLDLFVGRYVQWSPATDIACKPDGVHRVYCTPEVYRGQSNRLYHNIRGRRFEDVTRSSGTYNPDGKTLGVAILDHNRDGWPDIAVANDTARNFLFINNRDGTFSEMGVISGMAYSESGATRGGMGIDAADVDGDGYTDIVIGNFANEMSAFYRGSQNGYYTDDAAQAGIGFPSLMSLAFGTLWVDFDNDGWLDLVIANGHIEPDISSSQKLQTYAQKPQFFRNDGHGNFVLVTGGKAGPLETPIVGRGLAAADIDGDGDLDLLITQNGRPPRLLRNDAAPHRWLRIQLIGSASNRTGYGGTVRALQGSRTWTRSLTSGRSYLSASEPVLSFGFGSLSKLDRLEITWPSGAVQTIHNPPLNQLLAVREPRRGSSP
jgi:hypothetical protein